MTGPPCFAGLPLEVQLIIGTCLSQDDFARCARVCKHWNTLFAPLVWRDIHVGKKNLKFGFAFEISFFTAVSNGAIKTYNDHIQSLELRLCDSLLEDFLEYSPAQFSRVTSIGIDDPRDDELLAGIIRRCSFGLKRIAVYEREEGDHVFKFGPESTKTLLKHASTLEFVRLDGAPSFDSKSIHRLLCSAPNLKELYLLGEYRHRTKTDGRLDVRDTVRHEGGDGLDENEDEDANEMREKDWVCTRLEVFGCEIGDIPRPDIIRSILGRPSTNITVEGTRQESIHLQRKLYARLGQLTRLRQLTLGGPRLFQRATRREMDVIRLYDCLAMTLESGLDLLKDLKELRIVELDDMEVYLGPGELAWMKTNWPKLKTLSYDPIKAEE
ncbi:hypothetical protein BGW39_001607 [Mortierella sp. 14UC]|nr:hypothetical protein BGW39_001607 [Mortierella sp. 14UC]